jgi:hypothetical protein
MGRPVAVLDATRMKRRVRPIEPSWSWTFAAGILTPSPRVEGQIEDQGDQREEADQDRYTDPMFAVVRSHTHHHRDKGAQRARGEQSKS